LHKLILKIHHPVAIGLDISDASIEILVLEGDVSEPRLVAYDRAVLEEGIVEDGKILDKDRLIERIRKLYRGIKAKGVRTKKVVLSLPESRVFIHVFTLSRDLSDKEIKSVVEGEAIKRIPIDIENIYWGYTMISREEQSNKRTKQQKNKETKEQGNVVEEGSSEATVVQEQHSESSTVLFVGAPKELVDDYREVTKQAGLDPYIVDIEAAALARAIIPFDEEKCTALVDIGARTTTVSIFDRHTLQLARTIPIAGNHFTNAIADKLKISNDEAESLKRNYGLKGDERTFPILQSLLQRIIKEVHELLTYYENTFHRNLDGVILSGGSSLIPKIDEYLSLNLEREVSLGESWLMLPIEGQSILYNTVIGLALRGISKDRALAAINVLPKSTKGYQRLKAGPDSGQPVPEEYGATGMKKRLLFIIRILKSKPVAIFVFVGGLVFLGFVVNSYVLNPPVPEERPPAEEQPLPVSDIKAEDKITEEETVVPLIEETSTELSAEEKVVAEEGDVTEAEEVTKITINKTETGWLNVREGPGTANPVIKKIYPGETYPFLEESGLWYKIQLEEDLTGWIHSRYATIQE